MTWDELIKLTCPFQHCEPPKRGLGFLSSFMVADCVEVVANAVPLSRLKWEAKNSFCTLETLDALVVDQCYGFFPSTRVVLHIKEAFRERLNAAFIHNEIRRLFPCAGQRFDITQLKGRCYQGTYTFQSTVPIWSDIDRASLSEALSNFFGPVKDFQPFVLRKDGKDPVFRGVVAIHGQDNLHGRGYLFWRSHVLDDLTRELTVRGLDFVNVVVHAQTYPPWDPVKNCITDGKFLKRLCDSIAKAALNLLFTIPSGVYLGIYSANRQKILELILTLRLDQKGHEKHLELLRFASTKSPTTLQSLDEFVNSVKGDPLSAGCIWYIPPNCKLTAVNANSIYLTNDLELKVLEQFGSFRKMPFKRAFNPLVCYVQPSPPPPPPLLVVDLQYAMGDLSIRQYSTTRRASVGARSRSVEIRHNRSQSVCIIQY